ncbi:hypothetical protein SLA2020_005160 [Shorea laevis]
MMMTKWVLQVEEHARVCFCDPGSWVFYNPKYGFQRKCFKRAFDFQLLWGWWTVFIAVITTEVQDQVHDFRLFAASKTVANLNLCRERGRNPSPIFGKGDALFPHAEW